MKLKLKPPPTRGLSEVVRNKDIQPVHCMIRGALYDGHQENIELAILARGHGALEITKALESIGETVKKENIDIHSQAVGTCNVTDWFVARLRQKLPGLLSVALQFAPATWSFDEVANAGTGNPAGGSKDNRDEGTAAQAGAGGSGDGA